MMDTEIGSNVNISESLKNMTADQAVKAVRELCAQAGDGFHGNIWPGSVTLDEEGKAVLGEASDRPVSERHAEEVEYVAPEFFWENSGTAASDVYSLGMLLYAGCNKGYLPFQPRGGALTDKDRSGALRKRMKGEKMKVPGGVSQELRNVIRRALSYEAKDRYATPLDLLEALNATDEGKAGGEVPVPEAAAAAVGAVGAGEAVREIIPAEEPAEAGNIYMDKTLEEAIAEASAEDAVPKGTEDLDWLYEEGAADAAEEPAPEEAAEAGEEPAERRYTVQKDFEGSARRSASAAPATRRKKKTSPLIPVLSVAAVAVIAGAVGVGIHQHQRAVVSQPIEPIVIEEPENSPVVLPAESPANTEAPKPLDADAEASAEPVDINVEEEEEEPVTGSPSIDGMDVEPASDTVYIAGTGTNLRTGPGTGYDVAHTLARGVKLQRTGTVNGWSQVQYEDGEYYVSSNLVTTENPNGEETESLDNGAAGGNTSAGNNTAGSNSGTSTTGNNNSTAPANSVDGTVSGGNSTAGGNSGTTSTGGNTGTGTATGSNTGTGTATGTGTGTRPSGGSTSTTTSAPAVTATRDVITVTGDQVNLRSGPSADSSRVTTLAKGTVLQRTGTTNGWSRVVYQGKEYYISDNYSSPVSASETTSAVGAVVVTDDVNVRAGAGTDKEIYGVVKKGERLFITGLTDGGKWYRVRYDGKEGYVNRKLIRVEDFAILNTASGSVKIKTDANVRSGPATDYTILGVAGTGTSLTVTGYTDSNWYEVTYDGKVGYVAGNLVEKAN